MKEKFFEYIFPTTCGMCGKIYKESLCNKCRRKIEKMSAKKVQIKYINGEFIKYIHLFKYENELRNIMLSYKFREKIYLYEFFVKIILKSEKVCQFFKSYDIIIPVPIHYIKLKSRGYNQCQLIASKIAESFKNLQYKNDILIKTKNNLKQSSLSLNKRQSNVKDVYNIKNFEKNKAEIQNKRILIFDDIYTTGYTINECTKVLKKLEPNQIGVVTVFKD